MTPDSSLVATCIASPNKDARPAPIDMVILHYTGMPSGEGALRWLCAPEAKVSAHYLVDEDGRIVQMVAEADRAWHAGISAWRDQTSLNDTSIGIEIVNPGHEHGYADFPDVQIDAVIALVVDILARRHLAPARVLAHSDVAPDRKEDPGERFPWMRLAAHGGCIACAPAQTREALDTVALGDETKDSADVLRDLKAFGYVTDSTHVYTPLAQFCITAFQRRFLPHRVDAIADGQTRQTLKDAIRLT